MEENKQTSKVKEYNVYIDESGDEGINRGSTWFTLTAIIVPKDYDLRLSQKIVNIKEKMNMDRKDQLHWNKILKYEKKINIIYELISENFKIVHVAINTYKIDTFKAPDVYPYFMSYLIERVTSYVYGKHGKCNIYISTRNENNKEKNNYLEKQLTTKQKYHHIKIDVINKIIFIDNRNKNLLQLADVCCSSFAQAIKYNSENEWEYVYKLKSNIWNHKGKIIGYGIKFYPDTDWFEEFPSLLHLLV